MCLMSTLHHQGGHLPTRMQRLLAFENRQKPPLAAGVNSKTGGGYRILVGGVAFPVACGLGIDHRGRFVDLWILNGTIPKTNDINLSFPEPLSGPRYASGAVSSASAKLTVASSGRPRVPRQAYVSVPVASLRNVPEKSALGIIRRQRYFRHSIGVRQRCCGRAVDQLVGHDAAPLLHSPLQRTQVRPAKSIRSASCSRPSNATALASGSSCNQPSTSHHTPSKGCFRRGPSAFARCAALSPSVYGRRALAPHATGRVAWPESVPGSRPEAWAGFRDT